MRLIPLVAFVMMVGCAEDVGAGKVEAKVEDVPTAAPAATDAPAPASAAELEVDKTKSKLGAIGAKVTAQHPIDFPDYTASVRLVDGKVDRIKYVAQTATLTTDHPKLREHLVDEDFLATARFPTAEFVSTEIKDGAAEGGEWTHTVSGDLTIRGKTKRVTFPAKIAISDAAVEAKAEFVINRKDFDVVYPGRADDLVQDNVAMQISFIAPKA